MQVHPRLSPYFYKLLNLIKEKIINFNIINSFSLPYKNTPTVYEREQRETETKIEALFSEKPRT